MQSNFSKSNMRSVVLLLLVALASAKVFKRCELARTLKTAGLARHGASISDWVCLAKWGSDFNSKIVTHSSETDTTDYGIFQIQNTWCGDEAPGPRSCGIPCSALISDDIQASIACARRINKEKGIHSWLTFNRRCQGDTRSYIAGCEMK